MERLGRRRTVWILLSALAAHLVFLLGSVERAAPVSAFFFGDSLLFLAQGQHLATGTSLGAGLPYHPPLMIWLAAALWALLGSATAVFLTAKGLMALVSALGWALFYRLIRDRVPHALWICLLGPLAFSELLLGASWNSEIVYRLLLLLLLWNGFSRPALAGVLHGAAMLVRAEHLPFALLLALWFLWREPTRRRWLALTAATAAAVVLPYVVWTAGVLGSYNRQHAAQLAEPLPVWVPVSFYGPLNFALAQREETIFFSRRTLPPAPGGDAELDPTFPPHHETIVHGYRLGFAAIATEPARFLRRSLDKLVFSAQGLTPGWTWRDLPKPARWTRPPVDLAVSPSPLYSVFALLAVLGGAWVLRRERGLLWVGGLLLAYRLGTNVAFFPYLRSVAIVAPFTLCLLLTGLAAPFRQHARKVLIALYVLLAAYHLATGAGGRKYSIDGERDGRGTILDDREVRIVLTSRG